MPAYKNGKTWLVKFRYKDQENQTKWKTKRGFATKRDALLWEETFKRENRIGSKNTEMLFSDFIDLYLSDVKPRLKESSMAMKEDIIESKIRPYFGCKKLCDITAKDVFSWQNVLLAYRDAISGEPYSKCYLKTVHSQVSAIFNYACKFYGLPSNPARTTGNMGSDRGAQMGIWTLEDYKRFRQTQRDDAVAYHAFELLYWCGIREGELLALTAEDFNLDAGTLEISKTFQHLNGHDIIGEPKTAKSNRVISMPDFLTREMRAYILSRRMGKHERLFPISKSTLNRRMQDGCKQCGVKRIRVHDLRHSHVSLLISLGYNAVEIADRLGHESVEVTYRYAHLFSAGQRAMSKSLDRLVA